MPRSVRSVVSVTALLAAACGAFGSADQDDPASPVASGPDAALADAPALGDADVPLGGDDAGPPPTACGVRSCSAGSDCASLDFAGNVLPEGWQKLPAENPPFVTQGEFLRATGKQGRPSYLSSDVASGTLVKLTAELDFRVNAIGNDKAPLGISEWTVAGANGDAAYLAAKPSGKLTFCSVSGGTSGCSGDLGAWTEQAWHHVRWELEGPLDGIGGVKGSVTLDCGATVAISAGSVTLSGFGGAISFRIGAPVPPPLGDYSVDVDNVVRTVERKK